MDDKLHKNWYQHSIEGVLSRLTTSKKGISKSEAMSRLKEYGPNSLPEKKPMSLITVFVRQFQNPFIYVLVAAAIVTSFVGEHVDVIVITLAILVNVIIGFVQEYKAEKSLYQLRKVITQKAIVIRDGQEQEINSCDLVLGDLVIISTGSKIPADLRLIETSDFSTIEASLTGESTEVNKSTEAINDEAGIGDRNNMAFLGTICSRGKSKAIVVATGLDTEMGKIAALLQETEEITTPLQDKINKFSYLMVKLVLGICAFIIIVGLVVGKSFNDIFLTSVAIAVAAIPEGLVIGVTAIMAIGMQRILKNQGLVRKLLAAETLGSTTIICTDKTGTLTEGKMKVSKIITVDDIFEFEILNKKIPEYIKDILKIGMFCNNTVIQNPDEKIYKWTFTGNPTEVGLFSAGIKAKLNPLKLDKEYVILDEKPFNSGLKYSLSLRDNNGKKKLYITGAPEKILKSCTRYLDKNNKSQKLDSIKRQELIDNHLKTAKSGYRVVALGFENIDSKIQAIDDINIKKDEFIFGGFVAIRDPLRKNVVSSVEKAIKAGIKIVMITGDHKLTAMSIARDLGMDITEKEVMQGTELEKVDNSELPAVVKRVRVYARVSPQDKLRIVKALQKQKEVVAMTGDGVNDAPAIKAADIGVVVGSGTDVAKETSDLVILDNNFSTIVSAVEEGRVIFDNIKKVILYLITDSFSEVILITGALILQIFYHELPLPLLAAQILWINLVTDGFPNLALTMEPKEPEIMSEKPLKRDAPLLDKESKILIILISTFAGISCLIIFIIYYQMTGDAALSRTVVFATLGTKTLLYVFSCKSFRHNIWHEHILSNGYLIVAVLAGFLLQLASIYFEPISRIVRTVPLRLADWGVVLSISLVVIILIEITKYIFIINKSKEK